MPRNSFGTVFTVTTFGESHGDGLGVIIDGVPSGVPILTADIQKELDRRRPGKSRVSSSRKEPDRVEILSGVFEGITMGTPVALLVRNKDTRSTDYDDIRDVYRPGHADYAYDAKFGIRDWRGGGRASGRETVARVASGAVAKRVLAEEGIEVRGYSVEIAGVMAECVDYGETEKNPVRSPDRSRAKEMEFEIERAQKEGESVGGIVQVVVTGCPPGLGEPVFDKLDALLAHAVMSIGGVKGVEIGCGFECARMRGSSYNDPYYSDGGRIRTRKNDCGGILGGISTGEEIVLKAAVHPTPSISLQQDTVTKDGKKAEITVSGRHDPCIVPRVVPVAEAMVALTIVDCLLLQRRLR
jgi:chorismate synthase